MTAETTRDNGIMVVTVDGELNTITTPELTKSVEDLGGVTRLIFDLERVPYVSSAGLRLFLTCQRAMNACGGSMLIRGCNEFVAEIFESVGYDRIMKLERIGQTETSC